MKDNLQQTWKVLKPLAAILRDLTFLLKGDKIPVYKLESEKNPDNFAFTWQPLEIHQRPDVVREKIILKADHEGLNRNIVCKLCPERISGIRSFIQPGRKPVLVVHYTGEIRPAGKSFIKKSAAQILRTAEAEDIFNRMLQKTFGLGIHDVYFQEFPGCIFQHSSSSPEDWQTRMNHCKLHLEKTIHEFGIKGLIFTGSAALLYFGESEAAALTGKLAETVAGGTRLPCIVIRSPDAILAYEARRKKLAAGHDTEALEKAKQEEIAVKNSVVSQLKLFKDKLGIV